MSRELFEALRPYIQSMLDAQQSNPAPEPEPDDNTPGPVPYIFSATQFQDNLTEEWHRVFLYDGKMYLELATYDGTALGTPPTSGPDIPPPGGDEDLQQPLDYTLYLNNQTTRLTTVK